MPNQTCLTTDAVAGAASGAAAAGEGVRASAFLRVWKVDAATAA